MRLVLPYYRGCFFFFLLLFSWVLASKSFAKFVVDVS